MPEKSKPGSKKSIKSTSSASSKPPSFNKSSISSANYQSAHGSMPTSRSVKPSSENAVNSSKSKTAGDLAQKISEFITIYELSLEDDGSPSKEKTYIRLPAPVEPYLLRISIPAGSSASKAGILFTNFPKYGDSFKREKFHAHQFPRNTSQPIKIDLEITKPGAFEFYVEFGGRLTKGAQTRVKNKSGYFNVDPILSIPTRDRIFSVSRKEPAVLPIGKGGRVRQDSFAKVPLSGLVIQTVIAKWMGSLNRWPAYLDLIRDRGYNMIHFTPLQQRGQSGSPYSIYNQLRFDPELFDQPPASAEAEQKILADWLKRLHHEWGILSLTDVVWNHTANNSTWLKDHPESGYNIINSPHLEPALVVDSALLDLSSKLEEKGLPTLLDSEIDLQRIMHAIRHETLPQLKLWEYYAIDVDLVGQNFVEAWLTDQSRLQDPAGSPAPVEWSEFETACLRSTEGGWRHVTGPRGHAASTVDIKAAIELFRKKGYSQEEPNKTVEVLKRILNELNVDRYREYDDDFAALVANISNRLRYTRLAPDGPRLGVIDEKHPLIETLFTRLEHDDETARHDPRALTLANNGWIWDANPLEDFASPKSKAYLRREVIVWGDCVKLRYGRQESDSPFLWEHMSKYTELLAGLFHGFRIDNCHSTPIHVGEKLLDIARRKNPNLYVCAELFTGNEEMDTYFVRRLGINSLIREAMNGHDPKDQSALLYSYGLGKPIGSMDVDCLTEQATTMMPSRGDQTVRCEIVPLHGSKPHALLTDCTHDNEPPARKRTARDAISTGGLVTFAYSAIGSNKGFDDLYPQLLDLVNETRIYEKVKVEGGIGGWKRVLNHLHTEMALDGFREGHFHQENDYIMAHRVHPSTHQGYLLIAHTSFHGDSNDRGIVEPMKLRATEASFILGSSLVITSKENPSDTKFLRGFHSELNSIHESAAAQLIQPGSDSEGSFIEIVVPKDFPPGSLMLFKTWMEGLEEGRGGSTGQSLDTFIRSNARTKFERLEIIDLNVLLFRADGEERDATADQDGVYDIPGLGRNVYCGLQGWMHHLNYIIRTNDLGHPLCAHLRNGSWAFEYVLGRLHKQSVRHPNLRSPIEWFEERIALIKQRIPSFLRPKYFALLIYTAYKASQAVVLSRCSSFIQQGTEFVQALSMTAVQMYGLVTSASLDPKDSVACVAAGLPHFSTGWARTWGRDCAISSSGLFVKTGLFEPARAHLLCFCTTLKHGLMPNLLDSVRTPRYNSRDSPWFMMQLLQEYVEISSEGEAILSVKVKRRFPSSDEWVPWDDPKAYYEEITVGDVVHEILARHAQGIHFREYNSGPAIDSQMSDEGFNIDIEVDWTTGLISGGNEKNCGTWMDKMGESQKAGNKGFPGTPRDGAPVEIIGLLYSTLKWMQELSQRGVISTNGVEASIQGSPVKISYGDWADRIERNFERCYWVPEDPQDDQNYIIEPSLITRRGIYKDVFGTPSNRAHADYQLRPNFPIAMAVAPRLFTPSRALKALQIAQEALVGPLGMKTLDPLEADYRPNYDNSNDSSDWHVAKGRNYHQGPEWVWPMGYYLRAFLHFNTVESGGKTNLETTIHEIHSILAEHRKYIKSDPWAGLPELTNENGAFCRDSCETQAWSTSTILDALFEIYNLKGP